MGLLTFGSDNKIGVWYDQNQRRDYSGRKEAYRRTEDAHQKPIEEIKLENDCSDHHITGRRSDGRADNLFVTTSQDQHNNLDNQLKEISIIMMYSGLAGFDMEHKKYFFAHGPIIKHLREWVAKGMPDWRKILIPKYPKFNRAKYEANQRKRAEESHITELERTQKHILHSNKPNRNGRNRGKGRKDRC